MDNSPDQQHYQNCMRTEYDTEKSEWQKEMETVAELRRNMPTDEAACATNLV